MAAMAQWATNGPSAIHKERGEILPHKGYRCLISRGYSRALKQ